MYIVIVYSYILFENRLNVSFFNQIRGARDKWSIPLDPTLG